MKKQTFLFLALWAVGSLIAAPVEVISNQKVAQGFYPQLNSNATELLYLADESEMYPTARVADMYVTNEDLKLVLYKNGVRTELYPHGTDVNYVWASISPDATKILFNTKKGTGVCDLEGKALVNLGNLNAPVWYGNDYVVGMYEENDGHIYTGGAIAILSLDGQLNQVLTDKKEIGMAPSASYETGQIAYHDFDGNIHLMQINLAEKPILKRALPAIKKVEGIAKKKMRPLPRGAQADFSKVKIYINPGHGGFDSDDRGMVIYPFTSANKEKAFWESQSNLDKGLHLRDLLEGLGFQTKMSRVTNTTADDRSLSGIVKEANTYGADFMLSIHSNAGGPSNYVLQLFSGRTPGDTRQYSHTPSDENNKKSYDITTLMGNLMMSNNIATWSRTAPVIAGDKTFAREIMGWSNGYGVLRGLNVPGTISEGAMHDYYPETYRLMNMDYKHQEAWYFMKTFCQYYGNYAQTKGVLAGQVRDAYRKQTFPEINRIRGSRDEQLPLNATTVELLQNGKVIKTYVTDTLYNGVFFFWDLEPGTYSVRVPEGKYDLHTPGISEQESYFYAHTVEATVKADEITHVDMMLSAQRSTSPEVISYEPNVVITDSVNVSTTVALHFNWDMSAEETAAAFSIEPKVDGTLSWENSYRTLRFTPTTKFDKGTEYTVTLGTGACHPDTKWENHLQKEFSFKFRTRNRDNVALLESYPSAGMEDVPLQPLFITIFDEQVDNFMSSYKVVDANNKELSIRKRSFDYNLDIVAPNGYVEFELSEPLLPNADYTLIIEPSLTDVVGVKFNKTTKIPFRTIGTVEPEGEVVNTMEERAFTYDKEASQYMVTASVLKDENKKMFNFASNSLGYTFADPESFVRYTYLNGENVLEGNSACKFGMYVSADFSQNELLAVWDAQGDIQYTSLGKLDYAGWKYLEADMTTLPENVTYQFKGLQIKRGNGMLSGEGNIHIDNMILEYVPTAVENVEAEKQPITKVIENNQVIIIRNGVRYNVLGTVVE